MSFCNCHESPPMQFYRKETRKARQKYHCEEEDCREAICIGTRHVYVAAKSFDDLNMWWFRMCLECDEAWSRLLTIVSNADGEVCMCLGGLHEAIEEAFNEGYMDGLKDEKNVKWLMAHGYIVEDAFADDEGCNEVDERQIAFNF